ncbi:MAG: lysophospholipase [Ferrovibrio sp.]|uniref:alpha/beta hydrolase n=1 Tax=Ferrovibrio sp. TaxID=1917215 RepID=UPI00263846E9|nr:alpha/beta hydrolase [Ferrovibrio sp.]MCW0232023.1 lysophospholipase [Ferrovibrio sp.]
MSSPGIIPTLSLVSAADGIALAGYEWLPPQGSPAAVRAVVVIAHGMAEHAGRYARFAAALNEAGFAAYGFDHRGHGRSVTGDQMLGHMGDQDSWNRAVGDLAAVCRLARQRHPDKPVLLFAHSMGSFMAQQILYQHGDMLAGCVLCGSNGKPPAIAALGRLITRLERLRLGRRGISALVQSQSFGAFNKRFQPQRTDFDWLSRDAAEVDKYIADPFCGFPITVQSWIDLLDGLEAMARPENQARIPKALPVFVIAGRHDPVSGGGRGLRQLLEAYAAAGLTRVEHRFYDEARHELLNETNRAEITADIVGFLRRCL